jgi:hypothetical protein
MSNTATKLANFRFSGRTRTHLSRIVKKHRSQEPDRKKRRLITKTSVLVGLIHDTPVN